MIRPSSPFPPPIFNFHRQTHSQRHSKLNLCQIAQTLTSVTTIRPSQRAFPTIGKTSIWLAASRRWHEKQEVRDAALPPLAGPVVMIPFLGPLFVYLDL
jgi:hypothetical protein